MAYSALVTTLIILIAIVVLVVGFGIVLYNRLVRLRNKVEEAWAQVDVQLQRRHDLIPNLVNTVKGYASHEKGVFEAVTQARAAAQSAGSVDEKSAADGQMRQALANLFAVAGAYPDLKASTNFQELQAELARTEDQLAFARQYYNDACSKLNRTMITIPWSFLVGMSGVEKGVFYDAPEANEAPPKVEF